MSHCVSLSSCDHLHSAALFPTSLPSATNLPLDVNLDQTRTFNILKVHIASPSKARKHLGSCWAATPHEQRRSL